MEGWRYSIASRILNLGSFPPNEGKVKFYLSLIQYDVMKIYGGVEV
jgi:hypothetical protein